MSWTNSSDKTSAPISPYREKIVQVLTLAWPAILENVLQTLVGFVDTLFVSRLGLVEVAAVGITQTILQVYFAVFMAIGVGSTAMVARYIGANQTTQARRVAQQSVLLSGLIGIIFGGITLFLAKPILRITGGLGRPFFGKGLLTSVSLLFLPFLFP